MRGLRLYVRPIDSADSSAVEEFLNKNGGVAGQNPPFPVPAWGLLGKLLGDVVAVVALEITEDAVHVADIVVARELRRKWIGRAMMREVEQLATKFDRRRVIVEDVGDAHEFFRRVGFENEGSQWVRVVA